VDSIRARHFRLFAESNEVETTKKAENNLQALRVFALSF
jgi:hypothetical protein